MAYSPSRKNFTNQPTKRQIYSAQGRQENFNLTNFSQRSPSIRSPRLNEQSEYTKLRDAHVIEEVKIKLETVLKQNSQLLNQNAALSEMVNSQRLDFEMRIKKDDAQISRARIQMNAVIQEIKGQQRHQEIEISRLLDEISKLHQEKYRVQLQKNNEIKSLQQTYEKDMTSQIRNIKKSNQDGKQIYEIQVRKLKENIQLKNYQYQSLKSQTKSDIDKLKSEIEGLKNQIRHTNHVKQLELKEAEENFKQQILSKTKQLERENALNVSKLEAKIRKVRQDLINKNIELEQSYRKGTQNEELIHQELTNIREEKERLIEEIHQVGTESKQTFQKQKQRIIEIAQLEKKNIEDIAENQKQCLRREISKLSQVCQNKTEEIRRLFREISEIKKLHDAEKSQLKALIDNLKKRIKILEEDSIEEIELLKIKIAHLHEADIKSLQKYYENQVILLSEQNKALESENEKCREKIHKLLQDNDDMRKTFEVELTKYKAKVQDYKVKFASANLQFREQITSIGTKMDLTSQTLLRETEQKKRGTEFFETEKRKFHAIIENKDKQINTAYETISKLKELHTSELKEYQEQLIAVKTDLDSKNKLMSEMRQKYQKQFQQKSQKLIADTEDPDDKLAKENKELRDRVQAIEKQVYQKTKEVEFSQKEIKSLQQEVGLRAGFLETMQLQSSAAIQDERSKLKILMSEAEVGMRDYYEAKLASRNKDNDMLRQQLEEKEKDIRQLIVKYNQLENRLKELLEAQTKLSEFQNKIMNLGMDQNLVKNVSELFARYRSE